MLAALAASSRWSKLLLPALPEVFYCLAVLMQIPPATEIAWRSDLAQYLEDEDQDTFAVSTRVAAQQCVLELLDWYGPDFGAASGPRALLERLCSLLPADTPTRDALGELVRAKNEPTLRFKAYDWGSNEA